MHINCDVCKGKKKILGLGNMQKDCDECLGTGWIKLPDEELKVTLADVMNVPKPRKKKPVSQPVLQYDGA